MNLTTEQVVEQFAGKSVCVVGNAPDILEHRYGERIDAHDIVLRMNAGVPELRPGQEHALGRRTDILTVGLLELLTEALDAGCKPGSLWWMKTGTRLGIRQQKMLDQMDQTSLPPLWRYSTEHEDVVRERLGGKHHPTTGLRAIGTLCLAEPGLVSATGFNFFGHLSGSSTSWWKTKNRIRGLKLPGVTHKPAAAHNGAAEYAAFEGFGMTKCADQWWEMEESC